MPPVRRGQVASAKFVWPHHEARQRFDELRCNGSPPTCSVTASLVSRAALPASRRAFMLHSMRHGQGSPISSLCSMLPCPAALRLTSLWFGGDAGAALVAIRMCGLSRTPSVWFSSSLSPVLCLCILSLVLSLGNYRNSKIGVKQESLTESAIVSGPLVNTRGFQAAQNHRRVTFHPNSPKGTINF